jgi:hypothetical protein
MALQQLRTTSESVYIHTTSNLFEENADTTSDFSKLCWPRVDHFGSS